MRIRPISVCVGLGLTASCALASHAANYNPPVVLQDPGDKGFSQPYAINNAGQSVGYSDTSTGYLAVLWSSSGIAMVLNDPGGHGDAAAYAINASGHSVGAFATANSYEAVRWSPTGQATVLTTGPVRR